jgi:hypothetical protein
MDGRYLVRGRVNQTIPDDSVMDFFQAIKDVPLPPSETVHEKILLVIDHLASF